ncbi:MAG: hypothetical protein LUB59_05740, partial [Candidatus Gastranaerophilales bacterium]|nr:hypothetical protein [Candidatus Gastranaerophilales bacterium]
IIESQNEQLKKQSEHINKLEEKLTTVLEFAAKNDLNELSVKINDIDTKMERLNKSIERLTSYVNED